MAADATMLGDRKAPSGGGLPHPRGHGYFTLALLVALAGFFPSFIARLGETDGAHLLHGLSAFAWMGLLVVQSWLVHHGGRAAHRRIGRWSWLIVLPMLVGAALMLRSMLGSSGEFSRVFGPMLAFIDITTISYFLGAYLLALHFRRRVHLHARLMASTAVLVLPPALARLLLVLGITGAFPVALQAALFLTEAVAAALLVSDWRRGRVHPPYVVLLVFLVLQHALLSSLPNSQAWQALCRWIAAAG